MTYLCHLLIVGLYVACPIVAAAWAVRARRRGVGRPLRRVRRALVGGAMIGTLVCGAYAWAAHGRPQLGQVLLTAYLATSFILLLGVVDRGLWAAVQWLFHLSPALGSGRIPGRWLGARVFGALILRAAIVCAVIVPYVVAAALTYSPRTSPTTDPWQLCRWPFEAVRFPATDGTRIAGWWIPTPSRTPLGTLVLCPGVTGGPASVLSLAAGLRADGYNVLTFDFRAHGDSGGQLVSYGDLERRDVLGAVRWLQQAHPDAANRIVGLGVSTGAAALIAAAADPSPLGQSIDAVAVYAPYDRLDRLVSATLAPLAPPPVGWLLTHVGLPLAGLQVGSPMASFSPATAAGNLWPRPLLVLHGMSDEFIPFAQGQAVFGAASEPKQSLFIGQCSHADLLDSAAARRAVRQYFDRARRLI